MKPLTASALLARDVIAGQPTQGIPSWLLHIMEHSCIERLARAAAGAYRAWPEAVYLAMQRAIGTCMIDQYIPTNPLSMGARGYEGPERTATTGAAEITLDGVRIDSPEAVVDHLERWVFPALRADIAAFDAEARTAAILAEEAACQEKLAPDILKVPYGAALPALRYGAYGYANYFMAYALYPEVMERDFALQADLAALHNAARAAAYCRGDLPRLCRVDHDMADSRGTLVNIRSLDEIWFPHFARALRPLLDADVKLIWHCDGNLMAMVPRLLEVGFAGFQGFQYEDGMDYEKICRMKTRAGDELFIIAGVSVTRTLPRGTPADVKDELDWLVAHGPRHGLFLGGSSSITPGAPWENLKTLVEGLRYYREHGRP